MATKRNTQETVSAAIKPGTPAMESYLRIGYPDMTVEKAHLIIKERKENPQSWPYEMLERAQAFLAAYEQGPETKVIGNKKPQQKLERHNLEPV